MCHEYTLIHVAEWIWQRCLFTELRFKFLSPVFKLLEINGIIAEAENPFNKKNPLTQEKKKKQQKTPTTFMNYNTSQKFVQPILIHSSVFLYLVFSTL